MAQTKKSEATSTKPAKPTPKLAVAKAEPMKKAAPAAKSAPKKEEGTTKTRALGDLAGKKIFLNMQNEKVSTADGNNPKRGKCRAWFDWYIKGGALKGGCPVEEYFKLGGKTGYVRWDLAHGLITLK